MSRPGQEGTRLLFRQGWIRWVAKMCQMVMGGRSYVF